jgi:hypothetical protein
VKLNSTNLRFVVACIITLLWVIAFVLDATVPAYDVPASVHGLMAMVAAYLFGPTITGRGDKNAQDDNH